MPLIEPLDAPDVPLGLEPAAVPVVDPAVDPVPELELEPYGFDALLDDVSELPKLTLVRMNCCEFDDELMLPDAPLELPLVALPDVPVAPAVPAWSAGVTHPVSVTVFESLSLSHWLDELWVVGLV